MKKMILVAAAAAMAFGVQAEFKKNPDANTLWSETGGNAKYSYTDASNSWRLAKDKFTEGSDKTKFHVVGGGTAFGRYVNLNKEYPWLVIKLAKAENAKKGYFGLSTGFNNGPRGVNFGVSKLKLGTYVKKLDAPEKTKMYYMATYFYGSEMAWDYIGVQKTPEVAPEFTNKTLKKGEELVLTVTLQKPADGIQAKFFKCYTMPQIKLNGKKSMELTPNADKKVWTLKVPFDNFSDIKPEKGKSVIDENAILFELEVARGDNTEKVYINNTFTIEQ